MQQRIVFGLAAMACAALAVQRPAAQATFKAGVDLVSFGVTVVDRKGNPIVGLAREDFAVYEEGKPQPIEYFAQGHADAALPPLHLGLLFDTSGSMQDDMRFARSAAIKFLNTLPDAEDITLVDFDTEVRVARYGQADFPRLVERIRMREPDGYTALYDALGVYLDGAFGQDGRKILVLYTDGGDTRSVMTYAELCNMIKMSDVTVYAVGFLQHQRSSTRLDQQMKLRQLAELTGGQAFFPTAAQQLDAAYDEIVREIRAQYHLGFAPGAGDLDGSWRKVEIRLRRGDLKDARIRARPGYFAPYRQGSSR